MIGAARRAPSPDLRFIHADAHALDLSEKFDVIILSDLVNDLWDVQTVLNKFAQLTTPRTRIIINSYSRLWEPFLKAGPMAEFGQADIVSKLADCRGHRQPLESCRL